MPEMSRLSPSGKYILLPTTFKVPAVGAQPCRILKQISRLNRAGLGNHESTDRAAAILQRLKKKFDTFLSGTAFDPSQIVCNFSRFAMIVVK